MYRVRLSPKNKIENNNLRNQVNTDPSPAKTKNKRDENSKGKKKEEKPGSPKKFHMKCIMVVCLLPAQYRQVCWLWKLRVENDGATR